MKHLDIYRWSYKDPERGNSHGYWCTTQIGVVINDKFMDTYWEWPPDRMFNTGKKWSIDKAQADLNLEFIANLDDLEELRDVPEWYDNVIDLTHSNTSRNLRFIRKGQKRSIPAQIANIQKQINNLISEIDYKTSKINSLNRDLRKLERGEQIL